MDQRPASNFDHAKKRQAHDSGREMSLAPWSVFDAGSAKILVKLRRLFTAQMDTSDQATVATPTRRLLRTNEEKRRIVAEAMVPGASVAAVARKHGVNANLLFGWRRTDRPRKVGLRPGLPTWPVTRIALARAGGLNLLSAYAWKRTLTPYY